MKKQPDDDTRRQRSNMASELTSLPKLAIPLFILPLMLLADTNPVSAKSVRLPGQASAPYSYLPPSHHIFAGPLAQPALPQPRPAPQESVEDKNKAPSTVLAVAPVDQQPVAPQKQQNPANLAPAPYDYLMPLHHVSTEKLIATPLPAARPEPVINEEAPTPDEGPIPPAEKPTAPTPAPPDPRSSEKPAEQLPEPEQACRRNLQTLGVNFENRSAEIEENGCALLYPVNVTSLGANIRLQPPALMNCATAETLARFTAEIISPATRKEFNADLKSIAQASSYVCRPRNGTTKLSEHAFGNAFDIGSFELANGEKIEVIEQSDEKKARFLNAVRAAACGPFKTVLGPGSNADHAYHFHFDLAPRRNGSTYCK